jgi:hypothetical protein
MHIVMIDLPQHYMYTLPFVLLASFPRGFYGALAFFLFEGLLLSQVAKTYFEYLPECTLAPIAFL